MRRPKYRPVVTRSIMLVDGWFTVDCDFEIVAEYGSLWLVLTRDKRHTSDRFRDRHFLIVDSLFRDWYMDMPLLGYVDTYRIGQSLYHVFEDDWNAYYPTLPTLERRTRSRGRKGGSD